MERRPQRYDFAVPAPGQPCPGRLDDQIPGVAPVRPGVVRERRRGSTPGGAGNGSPARAATTARRTNRAMSSAQKIPLVGATTPTLASGSPIVVER